MEGHQDSERIGEHDVQRMAERTGFVPAEEEKAT